jgi:hypothetical protein
LYQEAPFENEFDLIETKSRSVNEQVNFGVYIRDLDKYEVEVFIVQEQISFVAKLWYHIFESPTITLTVSWYIDWVGTGLNCNMITQQNPRRGIIVISNMIMSIARADATTCICFVDDIVADCLVVLDCQEEG